MKKKLNRKNILNLIFFIIVLIIIIIFTYLGVTKNKSKVAENNQESQEQTDYENMKNNSIMYNNNSSIQELKEEYNITRK